jgi:hypothetical protein
MKRSDERDLRVVASGVDRLEEVAHVRADAALRVAFARLAPGQAGEQVRVL